MLFFQAEDGIRDIGVTGVQTCALPICGQVCAPDYKSRNVRSVRYAAAASAMRRLNPQLRLGPTSRGCNLVSRAKIGRASCRERVQISVVAVSLKKKLRNGATFLASGQT